jgi:hypothetical protein
MTNRSHSAEVEEFLYSTLAGGASGVLSVEAMARAAGLLGEDQRITHSKAFKAAKKSLGIRSVRNGFGSAGVWLWLLEQPDPPVSQPPSPVAPRGASTWIEGVRRLHHHHPPTDIHPHRWRQFLEDCNKFLASGDNWADRAAGLGWNALSLFGYRPHRPLLHHGSAGLLWALSGGRLLELHRDWAVFERSANGSQRIFDRRSIDAPSFKLPWADLTEAMGPGSSKR